MQHPTPTRTALFGIAMCLLIVALIAYHLINNAALYAPRPIVAPRVTPSPSSWFLGLNLDGMDQDICCGHNVSVDVPMSHALLSWAVHLGFHTFRVPISWAALQPSFLKPLNRAYLREMDAIVSRAAAVGATVAFVPMDKRNGTARIPRLAAVEDLWNRLSAHYADTGAGLWGYDLFNEPGSDANDAWNTRYVPSLVKIIRQHDSRHVIIIPTATGGYGENFAAHTAGMPLSDPAGNVLYEAHFYVEHSAHDPPHDTKLLTKRATDFVNWCATNQVPCYVGEFGVPGGWKAGNRVCITAGPNPSTLWDTLIDTFLTYLDAHHISSTYWEAGPYSDTHSVGPVCDRSGRISSTSPAMPQMRVLTRHLGQFGTPPASYHDYYIPHTTNLQRNPGFEDGTLSPMQVSGNVTDACPCRTGTGAVQVVADGHSNAWERLSRLASYVQYTYGVWAKGPPGLIGKLGPTVGASTVFSTDGTWHFYTVTWLITGAQTVSIGLYAAGNSRQHISYDDAQLVRASYIGSVPATFTPTPTVSQVPEEAALPTAAIPLSP